MGVVLNLAVWSGLNVLLPAPGRVDWYAAVVSVVAFAGLTLWKWDSFRRWRSREFSV